MPRMAKEMLCSNSNRMRSRGILLLQDDDEDGPFDLEWPSTTSKRVMKRCETYFISQNATRSHMSSWLH